MVTETTPMLSNVGDVEKKSSRGGRLSRRWRVAREKIKIELRAPKEFLKFSGSSVMSVWECTLIIVVYLSVGVIAFSYVFENWRIVDSLYFRCVFLCTTWLSHAMTYLLFQKQCCYFHNCWLWRFFPHHTSRSFILYLLCIYKVRSFIFILTLLADFLQLKY